MINPSLEGAFQGGGLGSECLVRGSHWLTCSSLCVYCFFFLSRAPVYHPKTGALEMLPIAPRSMSNGLAWPKVA